MFHLEHIVPRSKGGETVLDNLAWACPGYNLHKSTRTEALDPETGQHVRLSHPRQDEWPDHFRWNEHRIESITAIGRAAVAVLHLNHERRIRIRRAEQLFGLLPSDG